MAKLDKREVKVAYFSMEIAVENDIKSYSGGLGILAGDTLKSAADLRIPMLGITLLNDKGYFKQRIDEEGNQREEAEDYNFSKLRKLKTETSVDIGSDKVKIQVWKYSIRAKSGHTVPVYFLDTDVEGNKEEYRRLTGELYGGDNRYRLMQEIVLGRGGVKMLSALGYRRINKYHMNEGHAALASLELLLQEKDFYKIDPEELTQRVRKKCVFTTHTPVKAGHDVFPMDLVKKLQHDFPGELLPQFKEELNMSHLALHFSFYVNGVALSHQRVSSEMFPGHEVSAITNGVHSQTWTSPEFQELFDQNIPNWRNSSLSLRNAFNISPEKIWEAHQKAKRRLLDYIKEKEGKEMDENIFTIGFARRFTGYKRSTLLLNNMNRLIDIHNRVGKMQIIYAGKAHPQDSNGKEMIKKVNDIKREYEGQIDIVFLEGYDMEIAKLLTAGVDIWLNTPLPPNEASGTSGMKAAHNGVPHFSTLDGWWLEGFVYEKTGWAIGERLEKEEMRELTKENADDLYNQLEKEILPRYYESRHYWLETMKSTIAINASFFNCERMLRQYTQEAYL